MSSFVEDELASTSSVDLSSPNRSFLGDESVMHHENQLLKRLNELSNSVIFIVLIIMFPTVLNILYGLRIKNKTTTALFFRIGLLKKNFFDTGFLELHLF